MNRDEKEMYIVNVYRRQIQRCPNDERTKMYQEAFQLQYLSRRLTGENRRLCLEDHYYEAKKLEDRLGFTSSTKPQLLQPPSAEND